MSILLVIAWVSPLFAWLSTSTGVVARLYSCSVLLLDVSAFVGDGRLVFVPLPFLIGLAVEVDSGGTLAFGDVNKFLPEGMYSSLCVRHLVTKLVFGSISRVGDSSRSTDLNVVLCSEGCSMIFVVDAIDVSFLEELAMLVLNLLLVPCCLFRILWPLGGAPPVERRPLALCALSVRWCLPGIWLTTKDTTNWCETRLSLECQLIISEKKFWLKWFIRRYDSTSLGVNKYTRLCTFF